MRTLIILLLVICLAGCKKTDVAPEKQTPVTMNKTTQFSLTSDSPRFVIPVTDLNNATEIRLEGKITTSMSPEGSSYVILSIGDSSVWHSSFMSPIIDISTSNIKGLISGSGIECTLSFYQISSVSGPYIFDGKIDYITE
jgi:hypothetical protein